MISKFRLKPTTISTIEHKGHGSKTCQNHFASYLLMLKTENDVFSKAGFRHIAVTKNNNLARRVIFIFCHFFVTAKMSMQALAFSLRKT